MSNALICDTCTQVFPEGAEGSVSGNGTFTRTVDGVRKELQRRTDTCPECAAEQDQRWKGARTLETPKPKTMRNFTEAPKSFFDQEQEDVDAWTSPPQP